jgi:hypothetical protein
MFSQLNERYAEPILCAGTKKMKKIQRSLRGAQRRGNPVALFDWIASLHSQ